MIEILAIMMDGALILLTDHFIIYIMIPNPTHHSHLINYLLLDKLVFFFFLRVKDKFAIYFIYNEYELNMN